MISLGWKNGLHESQFLLLKSQNSDLFHVKPRSKTVLALVSIRSFSQSTKHFQASKPTFCTVAHETVITMELSCPSLYFLFIFLPIFQIYDFAADFTSDYCSSSWLDIKDYWYLRLVFLSSKPEWAKCMTHKVPSNSLSVQKAQS